MSCNVPFCWRPILESIPSERLSTEVYIHISPRLSFQFGQCLTNTRAAGRQIEPDQPTGPVTGFASPHRTRKVKATIEIRTNVSNRPSMTRAFAVRRGTSKLHETVAPSRGRLKISNDALRVRVNVLTIRRSGRTNASRRNSTTLSVPSAP